MAKIKFDINKKQLMSTIQKQIDKTVEPYNTFCKDADDRIQRKLKQIEDYKRQASDNARMRGI